MDCYLTNYNKKICYGCRSCEFSCPLHAISTIGDKEGFLYPTIDGYICTNCGLCKKSCPTSAKSTSEYNRLSEPLVYAARSKDNYILKKSSSGGMFTELAHEVLRRGGAVVGCAFDHKFNPIHSIAETVEQLIKMRGSKYVQSDTQDTYPKTEEMLKCGRWVLYTGTPCQIAGLKAFLNHEYDNLITADLICHGTPSNAFFQKYLEYIEKKIKGKIKEYRFRDKTKYGWGSFGSYTYEKDGKVLTKQLLQETDYYYYFYYKRGDIYRECCYECKYASTRREGDFTIADYWNVHQFHNEFYPPDGVSLVLVNTEKGMHFFSQVSVRIEFVPSKIEYAKRANGNLCKPASRPASRDVIYKEVEQVGFIETAEKYCCVKRIVPLIKRAVPYDLRATIKKILRRD